MLASDVAIMNSGIIIANGNSGITQVPSMPIVLVLQVYGM